VIGVICPEPTLANSRAADFNFSELLDAITTLAPAQLKVIK
jgi:hypothetical protein